jgi:hypothetical protein
MGLSLMECKEGALEHRGGQWTGGRSEQMQRGLKDAMTMQEVHEVWNWVREPCMLERWYHWLTRSRRRRNAQGNLSRYDENTFRIFTCTIRTKSLAPAGIPTSQIGLQGFRPKRKILAFLGRSL